jgi:hypothetical protein
MRKMKATAGAAVTMGALAMGALTGTIVNTPTSTAPTVQLAACNGTTGPEGCGPGWHWQWNGPRGQACYPC